MDTIQCIQTRRSVRQYTGEIISDTDLKNHFNGRDVCAIGHE